MCYTFPEITSGATPANLLMASMIAKLSLPHTCKVFVGLKTGSYHATTHSVRSGRPDALPTELSRLGVTVTLLVMAYYRCMGTGTWTIRGNGTGTKRNKNAFQ